MFIKKILAIMVAAVVGGVAFCQNTTQASEATHSKKIVATCMDCEEKYTAEDFLKLSCKCGSGSYEIPAVWTVFEYLHLCNCVTWPHFCTNPICINGSVLLNDCQKGSREKKLVKKIARSKMLRIEDGQIVAHCNACDNSFTKRELFNLKVNETGTLIWSEVKGAIGGRTFFCKCGQNKLLMVFPQYQHIPME